MNWRISPDTYPCKIDYMCYIKINFQVFKNTNRLWEFNRHQRAHTYPWRNDYRGCQKNEFWDLLQDNTDGKGSSQRPIKPISDYWRANATSARATEERAMLFRSAQSVPVLAPKKFRISLLSVIIFSEHRAGQGVTWFMDKMIELGIPYWCTSECSPVFGKVVILY